MWQQHSTNAGLDRSLLKALSRLGFVAPTPLQSAALPALRRGEECRVEGRTGEGKTLVFALHCIASVLAAPATQKVSCVVLVPSRELVSQTVAVFKSLLFYCEERVRVKGEEGRGGEGKRRETSIALSEGCDILIGTPTSLLPYAPSIAAIKLLVVDECDAYVLYHQSGPLSTLLSSLPSQILASAQKIALSATLTAEAEAVLKLFQTSPTVITSGAKAGSGVLSQYSMRVGWPVDRYLALYSLLKLRLLAGKTLLFTHDINTAFKIKLFLERFSIPSAVLNSELPVNSRAHIISSFNRGVFDLLIATDEAGHSDIDGEEVSAEVTGEEKEGGEKKSEAVGSKRKRSGKDAAASSSSSKKARGFDTEAADGTPEGVDAEYSVSRGVDFQHVTTVVNFDFPSSAASYIHRIGRTARGGSSGVALTFVPLEGVDDRSEEILGEIQRLQGPDARTGLPQPSTLPFNISEVEGFRYRVEDMLRSVTGARIKDARLSDIRNEMLTSEALKAHFEDHPRDADILNRLKHDKLLAPAAIKPHLKDVPEYLLPPALKAAAEAAGGGMRAPKKVKQRGGRYGGSAQAAPSTLAEVVSHGSRVSAATVVQLSHNEAYHARRNNKDPLKSFAARRT